MFKTVKPLDIKPNTDLAQTLDERQTVQEIVNVEPQEFSDILQSLLGEAHSEFNYVADEEVYVNSGKIHNIDQVRELKRVNRERAIETMERIESMRATVLSILENPVNELYVEYSPSQHPQVKHAMATLFGSADARISSSQYAKVKELEAKRAVSENSDIFNTEVNTSRSGSSLNVPVFTWGEDELNSGFTGDPADIKTEVIGEIILLWDNKRPNQSSIENANTTAFLAGFDTILEARQINNAVMATLDSVDRETSYIDSLFGLGPEDNINMRGDRPKTYKLKDIWNNCFDCFLGAWSDSSDFKLNLDIELKASRLINMVNFLLDKIAYLIDLPSIIKSNICSLLRLGVLCPIEIAFLIASLMALTQFTIMEVILGGRGFLANLAAAILNPLFNMLKVSANFSIGRFNVYADCVTKSILNKSQAQFTSAYLTNTAKVPVAEWIRDGRRFTREQLYNLSRGIKDASTEMFDTNNELVNPSIDWSAVSKIVNSPKVMDGDSILNWTTNPVVVSNVDPLELIHVSLKEAENKFGDIYRHIIGFLEGLENWAKANSTSRLELGAKLIALSTLIGVLTAIAELIDGSTEVCERDSAGNLVPAISAEFFLSQLNNPTNITVEREADPSMDLIIDGVPVYQGSISVLRNPYSDKKFTLVNCQKGRSHNMSDAELRSLLDQLS